MGGHRETSVSEALTSYRNEVDKGQDGSPPFGATWSDMIFWKPRTEAEKKLLELYGAEEEEPAFEDQDERRKPSSIYIADEE